MFNDINLSNALALIDKPVWVITEVRGRNKNNRTYSKSRHKGRYRHRDLLRPSE